MIPHSIVVVTFIATSLAIWPQPTAVQTGSNVLWLDSAVHATLHCKTEADELQEYDLHETYLERLFGGALQLTQGLANRFQVTLLDKHVRGQPYLSEDAIVKQVVRETIRSIQTSRFVPWKLHKRHQTFEPDPGAPRRYISRIQVEQKDCPDTQPLRPASFFTVDESYEVDVDDSGITCIKSNTTLGTIRGLQTLQQLFFAHSTSSGSYLPFVPAKIADRPRWRHRGLSLDIARNSFQPRDLLRTIDGMALAKMNRLHIHATDSQSWPLEIPSLPELAQKGAYQTHLVWSVEDLRKVQKYGVSKGISVFVEIDVPGHTASITHAYPDLIAAYNELDWSTFAAEPLSGQLKLNSSAVEKFMTSLLGDLLPRTAPYTSLYHVGGDEVNLAAYLLDETVRSEDPKVLQPLLQKFIDSVVAASIKEGLQPVVWEEMLLDWNLTLPSAKDGNPTAQTLVQVWRNSERIEEVLKRGHRAIFGDYHFWYLDCKFPSSHALRFLLMRTGGFGGFLVPYPSGKSPPGVPYNTSGGYPSNLTKPYLDYCAPYHNWRQMYTYNPLANISVELQDNIEGGEVLMWSEQTDSSDLDSKLWPRVAAAAEVLWSGVREESMLADATRRLGEWRERGVVDLGMHMSPVTMTWCLMEVSTPESLFRLPILIFTHPDTNLESNNKAGWMQLVVTFPEVASHVGGRP